MRDDDDHLRQYMPLLRRIVILVAVLTAVPVILWTITAFVHSYVGQPKVPNYRPMAATTSTQEPGTATPDAGNQSVAAAQPSTLSDSLPAIPQVAAADARNVSPAATGSLSLGDSNASASGSTNMAPTSPTLDAPQPPADAVEPAAEEMAAAHPITGPIPLPRRRPHALAMAQEGLAQTAGTQASAPKGHVPTPRPRPDNTAAAAPPQEATSGPVDWIQGLFQSHQ
jgi:hypothetical protein